MGPPFPGHQGPTASLEVPLEMLAACHGRVAAQCATLQRLAAHLPSHGADAAAQQAATAVMRYFDTAARDHHADEEHDLFPALIESMAGSDAVCLRQLTTLLTQQHRQLEQHWAALRQALLPISQGLSATLDAAEVDEFVGLYQSHLACEDQEMLPMAQRLLNDAALERIGQAMRARRGVTLP
jgi:hemerythrin-like domain-containing protein